MCNISERWRPQVFKEFMHIITSWHLKVIQSPLKSLAFCLCILLEESSIRFSFASFLIVTDIFCHHLTQISFMFISWPISISQILCSCSVNLACLEHLTNLPSRQWVTFHIINKDMKVYKWSDTQFLSLSWNCKTYSSILCLTVSSQWGFHNILQIISVVFFSVLTIYHPWFCSPPPPPNKKKCQYNTSCK